MVYWGCSTARNRCAWAACAAFALSAAALLCVGAGHMWACNHRAPSETFQQQDLGNCRVRAGITMALCPVVIILGLLPGLLFFQSCLALPPPQPVDWDKGVPASGITVVRRTSAGAAVYRYDSQGKLLTAPDCYRHSGARTPPSPAKLSSGGPFGWHPIEIDLQYASGGGLAMPAPAARGHSPFSSPGRAPYSGPGISTSASIGGVGGGASPLGGGTPTGYSSPGRPYTGPMQVQPSSSSSGGRGQQHSPAGRQYSPHGQYRQQHSGQEEEGGTAEVYISLSPLKEGASSKK